MLDHLFKPNPNAYLKRAEVMLTEANMARMEHQAAAEHHGALAQMYAERVARLERELYGSRPMPWHDEVKPPVELPQDAAPSEKVRHYPFGSERRAERG
ncbi:hypothetical protein PGB34_13535 [Xenophilus arseniciresistens]|uniref:Uncharacterized protein n=2 Tax=Xenophilus arseniciresistens TaxID=1283306 RepID=A0AAE3NAN0_9BURK|nr:hypothetical protein [Xenophilus arseniciresistens]MDA7417386.1 hypothetical protein [Xenophilus arseniciresistens]